jgi:hypothetical protein
MLVMEQVANLLVAAGLGTLGKDLFVHGMPESVPAGLVVLNRVAANDIDYDLPAWRRDGFQVVARHGSPLEAEKLARRVMAALHFHGWRQLAPAGAMTVPTDVLFIRPRHEPIVYPRSPGDLHEASVNFDYACAA